mgnify:FL=1
MRNRAIRGMIGSATMGMAKKSTNRLRRTLERVQPELAPQHLLRRGAALDAVSTLANDYGRFKPLNREIWTADSFVVMQHEEFGSISEKEATWSAYGMDTTFIGNRVDFVIWDDLFDPRKSTRRGQKRRLGPARRWG